MSGFQGEPGELFMIPRVPASVLPSTKCHPPSGKVTTVVVVVYSLRGTKRTSSALPMTIAPTTMITDMTTAINESDNFGSFFWLGIAAPWSFPARGWWRGLPSKITLLVCKTRTDQYKLLNKTGLTNRHYT
jgi:hypothetical protein